MSVITTYSLGGFTNLTPSTTPAPSNGGNFQLSQASVPVGDAVLVAIAIENGGSVTATGLLVGDTQGNTYTLLAQLNFGGHLLAVFGSQVSHLLSESDYIYWETSTAYTQTAIGVGAHNATIAVDWVKTSTGTPSLSSGSIGASGDGVFGFSAVMSSSDFTEETGLSSWDYPLINADESVNESTGGMLSVFASETFLHNGATTYNPSFSTGGTIGNILLGLEPLSITGTMNLVEQPDFSRLLGITQADPIPPFPGGPFYFAYVADDTVQFNPQIHNRWDENIFSFEIKHDEGQVPTLDMVIQNPRVGLLNPGRQTWAYLSYQPTPESEITPLFFGVLVGIPTDLFAEMITVKFNARPTDYIDRKQAVAETLRIAPYYDPVFLDEAKRDDPDAVLEGWSSLYHVDRTTLAVTSSDILEGEDGTVTFDETTHPIYDSVKMEIGEAPLLNVQVQADVKWTQRCIGYIKGPSANIQSYTGASFKNDWPKPGSNIGGGWKCEFSFVYDVLDTEHAHTTSISFNWKNQDPNADDCSTANLSYSATFSTWPGISVEGSGSRQEQTGICDPTAQPGVNVPAKVSTSGTTALLWILNCVWTLRYDAKRDFYEMVVMNITANLQSTLASPTVDQDTELIKVSGADVGLPLETPYAWSDFIGREVDFGTLIYPNNPLTPGGTSWQICVGAGVAGTVQPVFSDIPGTITIDGSVQWASLGDSPPRTQPEWTDSTPVVTGEIMIIEPKVFSPEDGDMETTGSSTFFLCLRGGTTNSTYTSFEYLKPAESSDDEPALPVPFSVILGPGDSAQSNIGGGGGGTGAPIPEVGGTTVDGSVLWYNMGPNPPLLSIPIGGTMTNVVARSYFPTDRGQQSLQYLIAKARARLRLRARCIKIEWDAPFNECIDLTCRKNATLYDPRLPGGVATGKITSYSLTADKDGKLLGHVEIGVSVGEANSVPTITGTPEYTAATGYMQPGYQAYDGGQSVFPDGDIAYTPPVFAPYDDGLIFPLQSFPGTLTITHPIQNAQLVTRLAQLSSPQLGSIPTTIQNSQTTILGNQSAVDWLEGGEGTYLIECDPVAAEILIRPVTNGPFNGVYYVTCTQLECPKGIDLSAASSP